MGQKKVYYLCSEVSQFQRLKFMQELGKCHGVLFREVPSVHIEGFHCRIYSTGEYEIHIHQCLNTAQKQRHLHRQL